MGKSLIIKGADFSENCIESGLPSTFDYSIKGITYGYSDLPPSYNFNELFIYDRATPSIGYYTAGPTYHNVAELSNGQVFKITDDVFVRYNNGAIECIFNKIIYPAVPETPELQVGGYRYNSGTGEVTIDTAQTGFRCASVQVKKGDVIVCNGKSGEFIRGLVIKSTGGSIECVTPSYGEYTLDKVYVVENDGVAYYSNNTSTQPNSKFEIYRLGDV